MSQQENLSELVCEWKALKHKLEIAKEAEATARLHICNILLAQKVEGQVTTKIDGYKLVAKATLNYTIDKEHLKLIYPGLSDAEKKCLKYVPELVLSEFRKLSDTAILNSAVTAKTGMPQLSVAED